MTGAILALCSSALAFTLAVIIVSVLMSEKIRVAKRVEEIAIGQETKALFESKKKKKPFYQSISWLFEGKALKKIANDLSLAAVPLRPEEFLIIWGFAALAPAGLVALFNFNLIVCIAIVIVGAALPPFLLARACKKRMTLFDKQLSDALAIIGNCLRAGFSFNQAIDSIAMEMPDPIAKEFAKTIREIKLGLTMDKALNNMVERLNNSDLELIVSAVSIQRQVGGNLSEILDNIADTIKERIKLKGEIKVLTATGRTSGTVVGMLPVFLMVVLMIINPGYVSVFFESAAGMAILAAGAVLEFIGFMFVRKIVNIKF